MANAIKRSLAELHPKRVDILALTMISALLLIAGYFLPICTVRKLWEHNTFSVLTGIVNLCKEKYIFLAILIFVFSVIFPIAKLYALFVIWVVKLTDEKRLRIVEQLEALGKWSVLDVFMTAVIIVSVKLGVLANAKAEIGLYFFAFSIILAMIVTGLQKRLMNQK